MSPAAPWRTRPERPGDAPAIHVVTAAAFPTEEEAHLVDALREDPAAWIPELSRVAVDDTGEIIAHALLTRCTVGGEPALALAPCSVLPDHQGQGAGTAAIRAALEAARGRGGNLVVVLGHPRYYPRFGFTPAGADGIIAPFEVPEEAFLALRLDPTARAPRGPLVYPAAFGI